MVTDLTVNSPSSTLIRCLLACLLFSDWASVGGLCSQGEATEEFAPNFTWHWDEKSCPLTVAVSPDGRTLAVSAAANGIRVIDLIVRQERRALKLPDGKYKASPLAFSPDGKWIAVNGSRFNPELGIEEIVNVFEAATGKEVFTFNINSINLNALAFAPNGKIMVVAADNEKEVLLWNLESRTVSHRLTGHRSWVEAAAFSSDSKLLATSIHAEDEIYVWDVAKGKKLHTIKTDRFVPAGRSLGVSWQIAFDPDAQTLAAGSFWGAVIFVDPQKGTLKKILQQEAKSGCFALVFSADGKTVITAMGETIQLWEVSTAKERASLPAQKIVTSLALSPDGRMLASGSPAGIVNVWDLYADKRKSLSADALPHLWKDLQSHDAARAYKAIRIMTTFPSQSLPFLARHLSPAVDPPDLPLDKLKVWIADLDSDTFAVRQNATIELKKSGIAAKAVLNRALKAPSSLEARRRIEAILEHIELTRYVQDLQQMRSVEILEHIGTKEAYALLEEIAKGIPEARLTKEAKASLARLKKRPVAKP